MEDILQELPKLADKMKKQNIYGIRKAISNNYMSIPQIKLFFQHLQKAGFEQKLFFPFKKNKDLESILNILQEAHLIAGYTKNTSDDHFKIFLNYDINGLCVIKEMKPVSSVRQRIIINTKQIKAYLNDYPYGVAIIRTRDGIKTIRECWEKKIGGEFIAYLT